MVDAEVHHRAVRDEYDARADTYDNAMHRALADAVSTFCDTGRALEDNDLVVDVATGTGLLLRSAASRVAARGGTLRALGVDQSPGMLAVARRASSGPSRRRAGYVRADAAALPLADGVADLVTCVTALHLLPDPAAAVHEWFRVLSPRGAVVTATFAAHGGPALAHAFPIHHDDFRTPEQVAAVAQGTDLRLARHEHVDLPGGDVGLIVELVRP
jgi:ubiquinone/menaquinone biosynthesis C-methylase UbiE